MTKTYLVDVNFDDPECHVAMTTDAGACSLMNNSFIRKGVDKQKVELTEDQIYILREIGELPESFEGGDSSKSDVTKSKENAPTIEKEKDEDQMTDQVNAETLALKKQVQAMKLEKTFAKYGLTDETTEALANAAVELEDQTGITKALDELLGKVTTAEEEVEKVKVEKSKQPKTDLQKTLDNEQGYEGEPETPVEKSREENVKEKQAALKKQMTGGAK